MELRNTPICFLILLSIPSYVLPLQDKLKGHQINTDQSGLLAFKKSISSDPQNFLGNWNETIPICQWNGVSCSLNGKRVTGLDLKRKYLQGAISPFLCNLSYLEQLDLSENSLHGKIPIEFGSLSSLEEFSLRANQVQDEVPESFGQLKRLRFIDLSRNQLRGRLPLSLFYNCTRLQYVDLSDNMFIGFIPSQIGHHLNSLETLRLYLNQLSGIIPASLSNSSSLVELDLEYNFLTGTLPSEILQNMPLLEILYLSGNSLESNDANTNLSPFFTSISNLTHLRELQLAGNMLGASLGNLTQLRILLLHENLFSETIPPSLGGCINLDILDFSYNKLTGTIPAEIVGFRNMGLYFNMSNNFLSGELPMELSKMDMVCAIDLSSNNFNGNIPPNLANCEAAEMINLSHNSLQGTVPSSLGKFLNLQTLDLSHNLLSGEIPASLSKSRSLVHLNLSFNNFNGSIPQGGLFNSLSIESFQGNQHLCWPSAEMQRCHSKKASTSYSCKFLIFLVTTISMSVFLATISCGLGFNMIKGFKIIKDNKASSNFLMSLKSNYPRISYNEIVKATGGFEKSRLIGCGSFGHVYKGVLRDRSLVAVKVLKLQSGNSTKSFDRECQILKRIRHRNLMRIITACSLPDFKALVLPFMANGSLESHLYPKNYGSSLQLSLNMRVNICSDVAEGLSYLHHHSPVQVIHCDLKPCNILLDNDMTALVSDFGIARLVMDVGEVKETTENTNSSTANLLCGSIGYIAPEYGMGRSASVKGDVYSFGVLILEVVTRKRPTDDLFKEGLSLPKWVKSHYHGRMEEIIDPYIIKSLRDQIPEVRNTWEISIVELVELGLLCTQEAPSTRPTMIDAADDLDRLKRYLSGDNTMTFASSLGLSSSVVILKN
ncbi:hypothetical protein AQUCO_01600293v1 [Aquilegia coerulea]|uniref:non-specific serine/threonine protein kinase n=1 Tax=Aquilegia coerulea TaxID=218851 RepID=A0A2G5DQZ1_AQUCA|nr:hypothetical protein AQUCO_01600293v1 [Aquilegia coerulea]